MNVSVIGLGKLGLCTAACFAANGHRVAGFDNNKALINELSAKRCPIDETDLEELLNRAWQNLTFTSDAASAVLNSEITLIIVPTPSKSDGMFSNDCVEEVLRAIGPALRKKSGFHVVDVVSTVMPGTSERYFKPLLEEVSGKICGKDFGLVYNPEFIALGSVIRDFLEPDMVLIGTSDEHSGLLVKNLYETTCNNTPSIAVMSLTNAEITKLSLNCFVTMKISFSNELASICEKVPGADIDIITEALGSDTRVGKKYLKGGLGFGGPCFPRDNIAFQALAKERGLVSRLGTQVVAVNNSVVERIVNTVRQGTEHGERIALMGLSYKAGTQIIEESQPILMAQQFLDAGYSVAVHDPKSLEATRNLLGDRVSYHDDPYNCAHNAAAIVLLTNWPLYQELDWNCMSKEAKKGALLFDSWRVLKGTNLNGFRYVMLGTGPNSEK